MVLGGALGPDLSPVTPRHFVWQAWHLVTSTLVSRGRRGTKLASTVVLRGRRGTHGTGWRAWSGFVACDAAALCVAGVALGDIRLRLRGTNSHPPSFCVAGVALMVLAGALGPDLSPVTPRRFAWQAWHLVTSTLVSRGRRGTKLASTVVLRGRRGTHGTGWRAWSGFVACDTAALCVAGVALGDIHLRFTWQAWHKTRIHRRFAWQAWHSWYWVARLVRICRL